MNFQGEYKKIGAFDIAALKEKVAAISDDGWRSYASRQKDYPVHSDTETIPLVFDPDFRHEEPTVHELFFQYKDTLAPITDGITDYYARNPPRRKPGFRGRPGYFVRIILVRLRQQSEIKSHVDQGHSLSCAHRIHIPVLTNDNTVFGIAGNIQHLGEGEAWEINNRKAHAVKNDGDDPRVHLIFDYVVPGEIVHDPDGDLVA